VEAPLVVRMPIASNLGFGTQHSQSLEAWLMHIPGLKVAIPATPQDARGLIKAAVRDRNPVMFVENIALYSTKGEVPEAEEVTPLGQAAIARPGANVTVVALSAMVPKALQAAEALAPEGIEVEVIDPRTLAPLDIDTIVASVQKTGRLVVAHLAHKTGGVGAEIAQQVMERAFDYLDGPVVRVAGQDVPIPASQALEAEVFPDVDDIVAACRSLAG
jgi:pyruvate dehydrogenase E1 component beta subunit